MKWTPPLMVGIVATLGVGSCTNGANSTADTDKISDMIKAQDVQWAKDYAAKDVNAINGHYASDGALAGPGYLVTSDAERRNILTAFMGDPNFKQTFSPDHVDVAKSGDLATSRGQFSITMTDPATKQVVNMPGTYLTAYKKESDGSWKAIARFLTRGPVPEAADANPAAKEPAK